MTAPDEQLVQQLADTIGKSILDLVKARGEEFYISGGIWRVQLNVHWDDDDIRPLARAVLASGLVIPAEPVRQVAARYDGKRTNGSAVANRLRAILGDEQHVRRDQ